MSVIHAKYHYSGFTSMPQGKTWLETKAEQCKNRDPAVVFNLIAKICEIFHRIIKFFADLILKRSPFVAQLDKEIRAQQPETKNVGEWTDDNSLFVSKSSTETTEWKLKFIKSANHSIELCGTYAGGEVFREALRAIDERIQLRPALKVHLSIVPDLLEKEDRILLKSLEQKYPDNFNYQISSKDFCRTENHVKLLIIDGRDYIVGGTNLHQNLAKEVDTNTKAKSIVDAFVGAGVSDMDVVGRGKTMASVLRREFFKLWHILEYKQTKKYVNRHFPLPKNPEPAENLFENVKDVHHGVKIKAVTGDPHTPVNDCAHEYVRLLDKAGGTAGSTVTMAQMYFHPVEFIENAFKRNAQKTKYKIITVGLEPGTPIGTRLHGAANKQLASYLKTNNSQTVAYFFKRGLNIYHKKVAVFERGEKSSVIIGSYNLGGKSPNNYELNLVIKNERVTQTVLNILNDDIPYCNELTPESAKKCKILLAGRQLPVCKDVFGP